MFFSQLAEIAHADFAADFIRDPAPVVVLIASAEDDEEKDYQKQALGRGWVDTLFYVSRRGMG